MVSGPSGSYSRVLWREAADTVPVLSPASQRHPSIESQPFLLWKSPLVRSSLGRLRSLWGSYGNRRSSYGTLYAGSEAGRLG